MLKVYYARPSKGHDGGEEMQDLDAFSVLGAQVIDPMDAGYDGMFSEHGDGFLVGLALACDVVAFRSYEEGMIPHEVSVVLKAALDHDVPVFELNSADRLRPRMLSPKKTKKREKREKRGKKED